MKYKPLLLARDAKPHFEASVNAKELYALADKSAGEIVALGYKETLEYMSIARARNWRDEGRFEVLYVESLDALNEITILPE